MIWKASPKKTITETPLACIDHRYLWISYLKQAVIHTEELAPDK